MIRIVQLWHEREGRRIALVNDSKLTLLKSFNSVYASAQAACEQSTGLSTLLVDNVSQEELEYDPIYRGKSEWRLMPSFDHPEEPARCLLTGTGLTHKASAENRQAMHAAANASKGISEMPVTDSMRMYRWGLDGGRPGVGKIGVSPEWFYKGCGTILRAHGQPLDVPCFALDGGEEPEVAGVYIIDDDGNPRRVGLTVGNEFSDHKFEEKNYLYLAHSKLRTCAIGPELVVGGDFEDARGHVRILRGNVILWNQVFVTGENNMSHTVANLEHHHFKYPAHRRPGDAHIYFFGADAFSFGEGVQLQDGDVMEIELSGFGRALRNPVRIDRAAEQLIHVRPL